MDFLALNLRFPQEFEKYDASFVAKSKNDTHSHLPGASLTLNQSPARVLQEAHCISRCVRRAFLCGNDEFSGQNYEHRKQWVVDKLAELAGVFSIDICAYAVMSNHYHLVLHINQPQVQAWSDETVIERWTQLFKAPLLIDRMRKGEQLINAEKKLVIELVQEWRSRLMDLG